MKDGIKEILSKMERLIVYGQYNAYYDLEKQLLDYITNLQEELKSANESITWWTNRFNAVTKENEILKEEIKSLKGSCKFLGEKCNNQRKELNILNGGDNNEN